MTYPSPIFILSKAFYRKFQKTKIKEDLMFSLFKNFLITSFLFSFGVFAELEKDQPNVKAFIAENYDGIYDSHFSEDLMAFTKDDKVGLLNRHTFKEIVPPKYKSLIYHSEDFISYEEGGLHGLLNSKGEEVAPPHFDSIDSYDEENGLISFKKYGKTGFIDRKGFITELYEDTRSEDKGRVWLKQYGRWGLFDNNFKEVVPFQYDSITDTYNENFLAVSRDGLYTLFDRQNLAEIFPPRYEKIYNSNQGYTSSDYCNRCTLSELTLESPQLFFVKSGGLVGLIDSKGREIVRPQHEDRNIRHAIYSIHSEKLNLQFIKIKSDDLYGLIDAEGKELIPAIYEEIEWSFARYDLPHLFSVKREGLWTLLDILNKTELTTPKYEKISKYKKVKTRHGVEEGIITAKKEGLWVFLDTEGQEMSQQYEEIKIRHWEWDIITAKKEGLWVFLDTEGQEEMSQQYEEIKIRRPGEGNVITAKRDGLWTFLDTQNQEIMPPKYEELYVDYFRPAKSYKIYAKREGRWALLDNRGREIMPITYRPRLDLLVYYGVLYNNNNDLFGNASP